MRRAIVTGVVLTVALVAMQAATQAIDFGVFHLRIRALNCDKHDSVFGIVSLLAQLAVAGACGVRSMRTGRHRWAWSVLGVLVASLVLVRGLVTYNSKVVAVPLACVFCLLCWLTWRDPHATRFTVWAGLMLMATSLLLHEVGLAADASTASDYSWAYQIEGIVKHGAELAGWMLVTTGIAAAIVGRLQPGVTHADGVARRAGIPRPVTGAFARVLVRRTRA